MPVVINIVGREAVARALNRLESAIDTQTILDEAGALLLSRTQERFGQEVSPDGKAWAPLSKETVKQRELLGYGGAHPMLRRTGRLFNSIHLAAAGPNGRSIGTSLDYAALMQATRPFIGASEEDGQQMYHLVLKRVTAVLGG